MATYGASGVEVGNETAVGRAAPYVRVYGAAAEPAAAQPTAPTIAIVSPDPSVDPGDPGGFDAEREVARQTPIVIDIDPEPDYACVVVRYPGESLERVAYRRGSFRRGFTMGSYAEAVAGVLRLHILPDTGWPESGDPDDIVIDVDGVAGEVSDIGASS